LFQSLSDPIKRLKLLSLLLPGTEKEEAAKVTGSHWTMKVWNVGNVWGGHVTCQEHPEFNCLEMFTDGVEKAVDNPLYGGKAKVS
jgi:hypothetical protein